MELLPFDDIFGERHQGPVQKPSDYYAVLRQI
jgi:hypothetical protein